MYHSVKYYMTKIPDKGITQTTLYKYLNLPTQIKHNTNTTNYYYRADGVKVKKKYTLVNSSGTSVINTEYLDDFQYSTPNTEPLRRRYSKPIIPLWKPFRRRVGSIYHPGRPANCRRPRNSRSRKYDYLLFSPLPKATTITKTFVIFISTRPFRKYKSKLRKTKQRAKNNGH